jgi:hypothetical protein
MGRGNFAQVQFMVEGAFVAVGGYAAGAWVLPRRTSIVAAPQHRRATVAHARETGGRCARPAPLPTTLSPPTSAACSPDDFVHQLAEVRGA